MFPLSARTVLVIALATLGSRLIAALALGVLGNPQWWEYDLIAVNLKSGWGHSYERLGFVYAAYAPPLWSAILALLLWLPGETRGSVQLLQGFLCLGAALSAAVLARRIGADEKVGLLAGLLVGLQPSLLYYSVANSDPLPLNVFLLSVILLVGADLLIHADPRRALGFGFLVGLGVLARGTPVVALPVMAIALFLRHRAFAWRPIGLAALSLALCLAPWIIRNVLVIGAPVITSTTGENFWRGNHAGASGGVRDQDGGEIASLFATNEALPEPIRRVIARGSERERDQVFAEEALEFIRSDPRAALELFGRKLRSFWWKIESDPRDYSPVASLVYEWIYRLELALTLLGIGSLFLLGATRADSKGRAIILVVLATILAISLLQAAFYVQGRHRFLIEPFLLMFAAFGLAALARLRVGRG